MYVTWRIISGVNTPKTMTVDEYIAAVPSNALPRFNELRVLVKETIPQAKEVVSYGILGYKVDERRARVFISGWKDHLAMYPVPKDRVLQEEIKKYQKGKGTMWFSLSEPLPKEFITKAVLALTA